MKTLLFFFALFSSLLGTGCTRPPAPTAHNDLPSVNVVANLCASDHPHMLWRIGTDSAYVWVLGSIHMADSSIYPLAPVIQNAFNESQAVAVEINVTNDSVASQVSNQIASTGLLAPGENLEQIVGMQLWNRMDSVLHNIGGSRATLQPLQPWLAALQVANQAIVNTGIEANLGIDVVLIRAADEAGKEVLSLETPAQQIGVFSNMPIATQIRYLQTTLDEAENATAMVDSLLYYWQCGADQSLSRLLIEKELDQPEFSDLKNSLYTQRNLLMANAIEGYLQEKRSVFVIVGTAHLIGADSVIDLLIQRGMKVLRF